MRHLAAEFSVLVIRRFDLMARWAKSGQVPALVGPDGLHMSDSGYEKLGQAVAELILAASRPMSVAGR